MRKEKQEQKNFIDNVKSNYRRVHMTLVSQRTVEKEMNWLLKHGNTNVD